MEYEDKTPILTLVNVGEDSAELDLSTPDKGTIARLDIPHIANTSLLFGSDDQIGNLIRFAKGIVDACEGFTGNKIEV